MTKQNDSHRRKKRQVEPEVYRTKRVRVLTDRERRDRELRDRELILKGA